MVTLQEKLEFLRHLSNLCLEHPKTGKKMIRAIKKDIIDYNKPLKLPKPEKI